MHVAHLEHHHELTPGPGRLLCIAQRDDLDVDRPDHSGCVQSPCSRPRLSGIRRRDSEYHEDENLIEGWLSQAEAVVSRSIHQRQCTTIHGLDLQSQMSAFSSSSWLNVCCYFHRQKAQERGSAGDDQQLHSISSIPSSGSGQPAAVVGSA